MISEKQLQANIQNAKKSTGPATIAGKQTVSRNAIKHGLLSKQVVCDFESQAEFDEFSDNCRGELQPDGALQELIVEQIIAGFWRLKRLYGIEAGILDSGVYSLLLKQAERSTTDSLNEVFHSVTDNGQHEKAMAGLAQERLLPAYSFRENDVLDRLSRYEAAIQRNLDRNLSLLAAMQADNGFVQ